MSDYRSFAIHAHGSQLYGALPYVQHLDAVASVVREHGHGEPHVAAAYLHDVVEDTPVLLEEVAATFGDDVGAIVDAVTGVGVTRGERNAAIYRKIGDLPAAAIVKVADRIANVEVAPPGSKHAERYLRESADFDSAVAVFAPADMRDRLTKAYEIASRAT